MRPSWTGQGPAEASQSGGRELCYDALDQDGDGLIDEGCGLPTGELQLVLAWAEAGENLDLEVFGPRDGRLALQGSPDVSALLRDRNCPDREGSCAGQNVEVVYLPRGEPEAGSYRVEVRYVGGPSTSHVARSAVRFRLGLRVSGRSYRAEGEVSPDALVWSRQLELSPSTGALR